MEDRKLSALEKIRLERLRKDLALSEMEVSQIQEEEMEPILRARDEYEAVLLELVDQGVYPLDAETGAELRGLQTELGLPDEEVEEITGPILAAAEADYRERLEREQQRSEKRSRQEQEQKQARYRQEFERALVAGYPLDEFVREGLSKFQQSLGLNDEVVAQIEQPLLAAKEMEYQQQQTEKHQREEERQRSEARKQQERRQAAEQQSKQEEQVEEATMVNPVANAQSDSLSLQQFEFDVITVDEKGNETSRTRHRAELFTEDLGNGIGLEMVNIPAGTFLMGSPEGEGADNEHPQHSVRVPAFFMGKYPVTQAQWRAVAAMPQVERELNPEPSNFMGENRPVEQVSWHDAVEFCARLSQFSQHTYRLPSEAEWEYACRAGTTTDFHFGPALTTRLAQCKSNFGMMLITMFSGETAPVGSYFPNRFGLYDMHGNVGEWCADRWYDNYEGAPSDASAWGVAEDTNSLYTQRGGSWPLSPWECRSANRDRGSPGNRADYLGFRVACVVSPGLL